MMAELVYSPDDRDIIEAKPLYRVLAERQSDSLETVLMWLRKTNTIWLSLVDAKDEVDTTFQVPNAEALQAFYHPYAYAHRFGKLASRELVLFEGNDDGA